MKNIILCNNNGESLCGSDGVIQVDGRLNLSNTREKVKEYKKRFEKNFPSKFIFWTHFKIVPNFREDNSKIYQI